MFFTATGERREREDARFEILEDIHVGAPCVRVLGREARNHCPRKRA